MLDRGTEPMKDMSKQAVSQDSSPHRHTFTTACDNMYGYVCVCVCVPRTWLASAFVEIYANCCLNTLGPPRPFHPTQHITTGRPSNKAFRLGVSLPIGPLDSPHNPLHPPLSVLPLPRLAMRHASTDDRLMRRKYFYRIAFRRSPENQWQHFYGHQLTDWALLSLYLRSLWAGLLLRLSDTDHSLLTYSQSCSPQS